MLATTVILSLVQKEREHSFGPERGSEKIAETWRDSRFVNGVYSRGRLISTFKKYGPVAKINSGM